MSATTHPGRVSTEFPDTLGRFGAFGGRFVPETLMDALNQILPPAWSLWTST